MRSPYSHASMLRVGIIGAVGFHRRRAAAPRRPAPAVRASSWQPATRRPVSARGDAVSRAWPAPTRTSSFEAFDPDRRSRARLVFLGLPHEASMAMAPATRRTRRLRRRPVGRLPAEGRRQYPAYYGFEHDQPALLAEAVYGLPELHRDELKGAAPGGHARLLRHRRHAGVAAARRGGADRDQGRDRRRRLRRHRRRAQGRLRLQLHDDRRELHRLRAARATATRRRWSRRSAPSCCSRRIWRR